MNTFRSLSLFGLRVALGWLYLYAGFTKVIDPEWSAAGFITGAKTFAPLYAFFASPGLLPFTNFLNMWGLTLIGLALILGVGVRVAAISGVLLMALYYFVTLQFPYPNAHAYLVDEHVIYACALLVLASTQAGSVWGLSGAISRIRIVARTPWLKSLLQ